MAVSSDPTKEVWEGVWEGGLAPVAFSSSYASLTLAVEVAPKAQRLRVSPATAEEYWNQV